MKIFGNTETYSSHNPRKLARSFWEKLHLDRTLLLGLMVLITLGLFVLFSADNQSLNLLGRQMLWVLLSIAVMLIFAQIPPQRYYQWAPWAYFIGLFLLVAVMFVGQSGKGAQRWLNLGFFHLQPSEIMKLAMPLMLAWYIDKRPLPPGLFALMAAGVLLVMPVALVAKQPDLGTALIIFFTAACVLFLAGLRWHIMILILVAVTVSVPFLWHHLHDYQQNRVLTFLDPEHDPLGKGYHIIQSKIAIGSGGVYGKGYLHGTQSHLQFLPEHETDFIFAVSGEEFGLVGNLILIAVFTFVVLRGLYISTQAQDTFSRLVAGSLSLTFFLSFFINMGMVSGMLPVVGVPLPLFSYGGSSMMTVMAGFGIIMSMHTHRKLLGR